ncbi:hypothetical protein Tco_0189148 [Tanacetum coccineum]
MIIIGRQLLGSGSGSEANRRKKNNNFGLRKRQRSKKKKSDDQMNSVINCDTSKSTWEDLILYHEVNYDIKLSKLEVNTGFVNGLPKKWLSFCHSLINANHVRDSDLASRFGLLKYEENPIDSIYDTENKKSLTTVTSLSTAFFSTSVVQDFQDSPNDEKDTRSTQEYMNDLEMEFHERALLAKSASMYKN